MLVGLALEGGVESSAIALAANGVFVAHLTVVFVTGDIEQLRELVLIRFANSSGRRWLLFSASLRLD
jgi:hypothetical protein